MFDVVPRMERVQRHRPRYNFLLLGNEPTSAPLCGLHHCISD